MKDKGYLTLILNLILTAVTVFLGVNLKGLLADAWYYAAFSIVIIVNVIAVIFFAIKKETLFKLTLSLQFVLVALMLLAYLLKLTGILQIVSSVEELRNYIETLKYAQVAYVVVQFAQAVFLPIPTTVTILTGLLLFDPFEVAILSLLGIIPASALVFLIGKHAGRKVVDWIFSKEQVDKYLEMIKGKDKSVLTAMFLLPFFPDDMLCVVAGLSTMRFPYFIIMVTIARIIMIFSNTYLMGGQLIPFHSWGLVVWALILLATAVALVLLWKYGDKIENYFVGKFDKKGKKD